MKHFDDERGGARGDISGLKQAAPRLLALALPHWKVLAVGLAALAGASGLNLLFPYLIREILNGRLGLRIPEDLGNVTLLLIALFGVQWVFFYARAYCFQSAGIRVVADLRTKLYSSLMLKDIAFFDSARIGDLLSRLSSDAQMLQNAVTVNVSVGLRYAIQVLGGFLLMAFISWRLTLVIVLLVPLLVLASKLWGGTLRKLSRSMQAELGNAGVIAEETLGNVRLVRIFAGAGHEVARYATAIGRMQDFGLNRARFSAFFTSTMVFIVHSSVALVLWYGGILVAKQALTLGDLTAFLLYCVIVAASFVFLVNVVDEFLSAAGAAERIFEILDKDVRIEVTGGTWSPSADAPHISFDGVCFSYPSRPGVQVLKDITFSMPRGSTIALVGPSGSGKSTIASLIPRFYDPQSGVIRYAGMDLRETDLPPLRKEISAVAQDPRVFSVSIAENIRYGKIDATDEEIRRAAEAANIATFVEGLPQKYQTLVGDRGVQLSGGEKQRLAIARAILKDPKLLILDEATSALDSENEQLVQQALQYLMRSRTTLIIAHRLSTVQHADSVLVLKEGRIVQRGTHESLMQEHGLYQTLVEYQLL